MARPRKKDIDKQTKHLPAVRCTEGEYLDIYTKSQQAGLSLSAYIRASASAQKIVIKQSKWDTSVVFQLRKLAVNLNQQTRKFHETGRPPSELQELWIKTSQLLDQIINEEL